MQFVKTFIWNSKEECYCYESKAINVSSINYIEVEPIVGVHEVRAVIAYKCQGNLYRCDISDDKQHYVDENTFNRLVG